VVTFDTEVGGQDFPVEETRAKLFQESFKSKKKGFPSEFYLVNPDYLREQKLRLDIEIIPERLKDTRVKVLELYEDLAQRLQIFGRANNIEEMKKEYLDATGKPDEIFTATMLNAEEMFGEQNASPKTQPGKRDRVLNNTA